MLWGTDCPGMIIAVGFMFVAELSLDLTEIARIAIRGQFTQVLQVLLGHVTHTRHSKMFLNDDDIHTNLHINYRS